MLQGDRVRFIITGRLTRVPSAQLTTTDFAESNEYDHN